MKYNRENSTDYEHPQEYNLHNLHHALEYDHLGQPVVRTIDKTLSFTSKNRQKVSEAEVIFFSTFQFDKDPAVWDEKITSGGTSTFDSTLANVVTRVNSNQGAEVIRQTNRTIRYVPSRQNDLSMAIRFSSPTEGVRWRSGLFDEKNGIFLEQLGTELYVVVRKQTSNGVFEDRIKQSDWNLDRLDGTDSSGINLDMTKQQLLNIEYEWYGAGSVTIRFVIDNQIVPVHIFNHANNIDRTWMTTPFLPLRNEIKNLTGASGIHSMYLSSSSVVGEGSLEVLGKARNVQSSILGKETENANVYVPLISLRLRADRLQAVATINEFQASALNGGTGLFYQWTLNTSLSGPNWQTPPGFDSVLEYDINATAAVFGEQIKTGYVPSGSPAGKISVTKDYNWQLPRRNLGNEPVTLTLSVATTEPNRLVYGDVTWIETR